MTSKVMKTLILISLLLFPSAVLAQTFNYDRISTRYLVRDLLGESSTKYFSDSTINRLLNHAQKTTKVLLGVGSTISRNAQRASVDTISYAVPTDAVQGVDAVFGVLFYDSATGLYDALRQVPFDVAGRINGTYSILDNTVHLGAEPSHLADSVVIYYNDSATTLIADGTSLTVSNDDALAVAWLTCSLLLQRDKQLSQSKVFYDMWIAYIQARRGTPQ